MASVFHPNPVWQGGNVLFPDRAIAEIETLLLEPDSSCIDDPQDNGEERVAKELLLSWPFAGSTPTTTSAITTSSVGRFFGLPFPVLFATSNPTEERWHTDGDITFKKLVF